MKDILFVYGTLMKGHCNDHYLRELKYLGIGRLNGYDMYHVGTYPGVVKAGSDYVIGELYEIDEETLKRLDMLEKEGDLFLRKKLGVLKGTKEVEAYVYVWNKTLNKTNKKVTQMPWNPVKRNICDQIRELNSENFLIEAVWPLIIKLKNSHYYEACTVRGVVAAIVGEGYINNEKAEDDWQSRIKYSADNIMSNETEIHVVIKDKNKGIIAENCILDSDKGSLENLTYTVFVESERAFIYSLVKLGIITVYERENENYFRNCLDDGNNVSLKKELKNGKYINIKEYDIDLLLEKTWT